MPAATINQLASESATWKRLLSFVTDENIHLKTRLSEILKTDFDNHILAKLETFQTSFISTDALIELLRNDVVEFDNGLGKYPLGDNPVNINISGRLQRIRRNINLAERTFNQRQTAFNNYLSENI